MTKLHCAIPKIRFKEFSGNWEQFKLSSRLIESKIKGNNGSKAKKITVKLWGKGVFANDNCIRGSKNTQYFKRKSGQFIYSKLDFLNCAFGIIPKALDGYESTIDLPCFDVFSKKLDVFYLLEYVKRKSFYKKFGDTADGSRKAKRIHADVFLSFTIMSPSLQEQTQIGNFFQKLDEVIELQRKKIEQIQTYKKAMLQKMFPQQSENVPKIRFKGFSEDWCQGLLGDYSNIQTGTKDVQDANTDGKYPFFIRSNEIKHIDSYAFDCEAILIPGEGRLGEIFHYIDGKFNFHQRVYKISNFKKLVGIFVLNFMKLRFKQHVLKYTVKATVDSLRLPSIKDFPILFPSLGEQTKIGNFFQKLDEFIEQHQTKLKSYQIFKKAMLQRLFV